MIYNAMIYYFEVNSLKGKLENQMFLDVVDNKHNSNEIYHSCCKINSTNIEGKTGDR